MSKRDHVTGLGDRLREVRKAAGMTQAAAGEAAGVHYIQITKYETGVATPTVAVLMKLAAAYGVTVNDLLPPPAGEVPKPKRGK
jgi:transcriptional regulator with XRE-family HTH domain